MSGDEKKARAPANAGRGTARRRPAPIELEHMREEALRQGITVYSRLTRVGGSVMMAIPAAALEAAQLSAGASVIVTVNDGRVSFEAAKPPGRIGLTARLARCADGPFEVDREFLEAKRAGREEI